ncbi:histidinol dehydrogenase [Corynebacterium auriscanis]|uniref:histidinol dehydrogenase n=1 Tax=Corynebacterium auriscanis TaxID=99807 RepID=UPI003CF70FFF
MTSLKLSRLDLRGTTPTTASLRHSLPRGGTDVDSVLPAVAPVVEDIRAHGAAAALRYGEKFDGVVPPAVKVPASVIDAATDELDEAVMGALVEAIRRVRAFHATQVPADHEEEIAPGGIVGERYIPIRRVGLYVPGGKAVYPSSVIMNVVPAQEAGVESLVVASPPQETGWPHTTVLAACKLLGVEEVWAVGGAQAVALMAYGDDAEQLEPVDMITGPGNIFVTAAKRLVRSVVGIDSEAGPTEIAIVADDSADAVEVAYDLISQAEHDPMAASVLITESPQLADAVEKEIAQRYSVTLNADRVREALEGQQSGIVVVDDLDMAIQVADAYAAEHLEIHTRDAESVAARITNAGAIFIGRYSPVPLGDYAAGSNHVLPTSGTARHASGLSTHTFLKAVHVVNYSKQALEEVAGTVITLANAERLPAHGEAIKARLNSNATGPTVSQGVN